MLNVMIVDDEPPARARLGQVLRDCSEQVSLQLVGEAGGGIHGLEEVDRLNPDVVLLDIHMPDMNGIEMARHLAQRNNPPAVIFVTAYDEHALRSVRGARARLPDEAGAGRAPGGCPGARRTIPHPRAAASRTWPRRLARCART